MPMFEIKSRWDGRVLFALECGSLKLCVEAAVKSGAILDGAILDGARLDGARLDGARLVGASLKNCKWGPLTIQRAPIAISIPNYWQVYILDSHMQIGCELHSFEEWRKFKDSRIKLMDDQALAFWKQYGPALLAMCATRETGGDASGGGDEWATPCT